MHVTFALFADAANLSQEGKLNILGVFDALQVGTLPSMHPRASLVVHLKGSALDVGTHRVSLQWMSPSGHELWSSEGELGVSPPPSGVLEMDFPLIAQIDLPLDQGGAYLMRVGLDGNTHAEVPLQVRTPANVPIAPAAAWLS
ncbi:MAG TPA: hypothetical protein VGP25_05285 [Gemmatimonadaceae bacterium]|jgi:hypothetical protein|nr:hypothetical protein [Gemmatimonadaceae bacterium]